MPGDSELLEEIMGRLAGIPDAVRQTLSDHQWAQIPLAINEYRYLASLAPGTPLTVLPQTGGLEQIQTIVASVPSGATANIQLHDLVIPVGAGVTVIQGICMILDQSSTRTLLTATATGPASLYLAGQQLPRFGVLSG